MGLRTLLGPKGGHWSRLRSSRPEMVWRELEEAWGTSGGHWSRLGHSETELGWKALIELGDIQRSLREFNVARRQATDLESI